MISADWASRLLVDAPVAAIVLPAEGQPPEEIDRFVSQLAKRLAALTASNKNALAIRAIRRAQFEALSLTAELYLQTLGRSKEGREDERRYGACVCSFAEQVLAREAELVNAVTRVQTAARWLGAARASTDFWTTSDIHIRSLPVLRQRGEDAMLAELEWSIAPVQVPRAFLAIFGGTRPDGIPGWFDAFALYLAWQMKTHASLRLALFPELRSGNDSNARSLHAYLSELQASATALAHRFDEVLHREPEAAIEEPAPRLGKAVAKDLRAYLVGRADSLAADRGIPRAALEPLVEGLMSSPCPAQAKGARLHDLAEELPGLLVRLSRGAGQSGSVGSHSTKAIEAARAGRFAPADLALAEAERLLRAAGSDSPAESGGAGALVDVFAARAVVARLQLSPERAIGFLRSALDLPGSDDGARRAALLVDLVDALRQAAEEHAHPAHLKEAAEISETVLASISRAEAGATWAALQYARARVALACVSAPGTAAEPDQAADALALVLSETEPRLAGAARARAEAGLGDARFAVARRKGKDGLADLELSVAAYAQALAVEDARLDPMERATIEARLGDALLALARRRGEPGPADAAAASYKAALAELTPERVPQLAGELQAKLGDAFAHVGQTARFPHRLQMAIDAYAQALAAHDKERTPLEWGDVLAKIAATQYRLGKMAGDSEWFERAAASYRAVLTVYPHSKPVRWATTMIGLAEALLEVGNPSGAGRQIEEVIALSRAVVEHPAGDALRLLRARACHVMGLARCRIAMEHGDEEAYRQGLAEQEKGLFLARADGAAWLEKQIEKTIQQARAALTQAGAARRAHGS
jgi:tetratricopeptide (TPR) repeat protein